MYKVVIIIYFICFLCYVLFSRVPDYFEGDYTKGVVSKAIFSVKDKHPVVIVNYRVGKEELQYTSYMWFLTSYKPGQVIPRVASIYSFTGYWVRWPELANRKHNPFLKKPIQKLLLRFGYSTYLFYTCIDEAHGFFKGGQMLFHTKSYCLFYLYNPILVSFAL